MPFELGLGINSFHPHPNPSPLGGDKLKGNYATSIRVQSYVPKYLSP